MNPYDCENINHEYQESRQSQDIPTYVTVHQTNCYPTLSHQIQPSELQGNENFTTNDMNETCNHWQDGYLSHESISQTKRNLHSSRRFKICWFYNEMTIFSSATEEQPLICCILWHCSKNCSVTMAGIDQ